MARDDLPEGLKNFSVCLIRFAVNIALKNHIFTISNICFSLILLFYMYNICEILYQCKL